MWYQLSNPVPRREDLDGMIGLLERDGIPWSRRFRRACTRENHKRGQLQGFIVVREVEAAMIRRWTEVEHGKKPELFAELPWEYVDGAR